MDIFGILTKHFWAVAIGVNLLNVTLLKKNIKRHVQQQPELAVGYNDLLKKFAIYLNLPWALMGAGVMVGRIDSLSDIMNIRGADPFILVWWVVLLLDIAVIDYWIIYRKGAERLITYNRAHTLNLTDPKQVKTFFILCSAGVVGAFVMAVSS